MTAFMTLSITPVTIMLVVALAAGSATCSPGAAAATPPRATPSRTPRSPETMKNFPAFIPWACPTKKGPVLGLPRHLLSGAFRTPQRFPWTTALRKDQPRSVPWERRKPNNPRSCRNPPSGADSPTSRYEVGYHRESASWLRRWFPLRLLPSSRYPSRTGGARREQLQVPRQPGVLALLRRSKPWRSRVYQAELLSHGWCKKVAWAKMAKTLTKLPVGVTLASL